MTVFSSLKIAVSLAVSLAAAGAAHAGQSSASFQVGIRIVPADAPTLLAPTWKEATPLAPGFVAVPGTLSDVVSELFAAYPQWNHAVRQSSAHRWESVARDGQGGCVRIDARTVTHEPVIRVGLLPCP